MLAMVVNVNAGSQAARGVLESIASMLAPTVWRHITPYIAYRYL
jgi:hypothetical protein